jgi:2-keto-4-pentenoate hydratase/2-oxohepta-3-ene-1,7-dioic acid hydratase in catechol pathway
MRLVRIGPRGRERPAVLLPDGTAADATTVTAEYDPAFFARGGPGELARALEAGRLEPFDPAGQRIGPPIARPPKIVCIGLNDADHARESGQPIPDEPTIFLKAPYTVVGPDDGVLIPPGSKKTDYEVELGVVIGRQARYLAEPGQAGDHIAGYCISNDVSEREFQLERGGQWDKGKSCETFNPLGPWLLTPDEVGDPQQLVLTTLVNGEVRQDGCTKDMVFGVDFLVWYVSQFMVLEPGDLINTGTPAGVALGMDPPRYLRAGDVMELEISGLGRQRQMCRDASSPRAL